MECLALDLRYPEPQQANRAPRQKNVAMNKEKWINAGYETGY
jgi:hypothetical protein